jgi:glycosyltransferase involved in cell wall biosynthesis
MPSLSLIIPCYNEASNLPALFELLLPLIEQGIEIILVDNGSTDHTSSLMVDSPPGIRWLRAAENLGYGGGILAGIREARGEFIAWTHADLQTKPSDVLRALSLLEEEQASSLYIKGVRVGRPMASRFISASMGIIVSLILGERLREVNAMPNLCHRSFINGLEDPPGDYNFELYCLFLAHRRGLQVQRLQVDFPPRKAGESSWNRGLFSLLRMSLATIRYALTLRGKH